ncbi:MAG: maleylacetoacetate isomerase [Janthinobacterium lividum]
MRLHTFFNSSASYRVRIALALKGLEYEHVGVNIRVGEQRTPEFLDLNPVGLVPALEHGSYRLTQSLAIIDYLDRLAPEPLLTPVAGPARDRVLEIALLIATDIHPVNNMRILKYLSKTLKVTDAQRQDWYAEWIAQGLGALEKMLPDHDGWCVGDAPTLADCCLVPQLANAQRNNIDLEPYPRARRIRAFCERHPAFVQAAPEKQPDYKAP